MDADLSAAARTLWAKSEGEGHPLIAHMLDSAAVACAILSREPEATLQAYSAELELSPETAARWIAFMAGLHDLGKATPAFQAQWKEGKARDVEAGLPFSRFMPRGVWHGPLTEILTEQALAEIGGGKDVARLVSRALGAHHGFVATQAELAAARMPSVLGSGLWETVRSELVTAIWKSVGADWGGAAQLGDKITLAMMALTSFADWIASDPQYFPYRQDVESLPEYWDQAQDLAAAALDRVGWRSRTPLVDRPVPFERVFPFSPNPLQRSVEQLISQGMEPVLLIVEAPTGMGKTEAALQAHLELQRRHGHRGLYIALPTMATGNGMYPRIKRFLQPIAGSERVVDLQLQHGASFTGSPESVIAPAELGDANHSADETVRAQTWFSQKKRAMLSEYGVGTVDQALLGVLRVRHHFIRLWGLANRTVVLDEVHAYDAYTTGIIEGLLKWLRTLGSSVVLMSATLPSSRRQALIQAYGGEPLEVESPYPRLTMVSGDHTQDLTFDSGVPRALSLMPAPKPVEELAGEVLASVRGGGCGACVVNTVSRAQRLYVALGEGEPIHEQGTIVGKSVDGTPVYLFHARFPAGERSQREACCQRLFGKEGYTEGFRPRRAVLVATQVVEQSLDIDFDVMFTDLAPVDLLLQRAGRLHRFDLEAMSQKMDCLLQRPPQHPSPQLNVAGLTDGVPELRGEGWEKVYEPFVLLMTWWVLRGRKALDIPGDLEEVIEAVYEGGIPTDVPDELQARFREQHESFNQTVEEHRRWAKSAAVSDPSQLLSALPTDLAGRLELDDEEECSHSQVPLTRLGDPSVETVLLHRVAGELHLNAEGNSVVLLQGKVDEDQASALYERSVRLAHKGVYRALQQENPPCAWRRHRLLRRMRPLGLVNGQATLGRTVVRLDPELGVVFERSGAA